MAEKVETDVCVIGGGAGGLSFAAGAAQMGADVTLVVICSWQIGFGIGKLFLCVNALCTICNLICYVGFADETTGKFDNGCRHCCDGYWRTFCGG